eukprot:3411-Alexandrium_andersonii.AAC.1
MKELIRQAVDAGREGAGARDGAADLGGRQQPVAQVRDAPLAVGPKECVRRGGLGPAGGPD